VEQVGTRILSEQHCHLGEGCTYDPVTDTAWWFDIIERPLFQFIDVYTPEGGHVRTIRVPATQPSCPAFVGRHFDRLLVTTAWEGMDEQARAADPNHGRTFILDVGARGRAEPRVRLGPA